MGPAPPDPAWPSTAPGCSPSPAWAPRQQGGGTMQSRAAAADICSPSVSAPSFLFCQQQLLAANGHQSQRGPADLYSSSLGSLGSLAPRPLLRKVKGERGEENQEGRVRVK